MKQNEFIPYVGPRPFERKEDDAARFFGRSQETQEIVSLIFGHPVTLVYAQSGAGKTSLFNTSIALKLEERGFDVLPLTRVGGVVPQGFRLDDIKNLYVFNALLKLDSGSNPKDLLTKTLSTFLQARNRSTDETGEPLPVAIIFDQFEELFTYTPENWREQRDEFFQQVVDAVKADPLLRVVFVIREDFLAELDPYARNLPERLRIRYRLERLGKNAALHAIKDPLLKTRRKFAPDVAEGLVKELLVTRTVDASGTMVPIEGQYVEPVQLQVVCVTLWSTLEPDVTEIQLTHLQNFDVNSALSDFYKAAVEAAAHETGMGEIDVRNWFGKTLITPMGTRSTVFRGESSTGGIPNSAVDFLESRHIIRAEIRAGVRWYELTHDRFIQPILDNNKDWFTKNTSLLQQQAAQWIHQERSDGLLLRDQALENAEKEAASRKLSNEEKEFLEKCREFQKRNRRLRTLQRAVFVAFVVSLIATVVAIFLYQRATNATQRADRALVSAKESAEIAKQAAENEKQARMEADKQRENAQEQADRALAGSLAAQADSIKNSDHILALLLGLEAYDREQNLLTRTTLFNLLQFTPYKRTFGFMGSVTSAAVSPDGKWIAVASCKENSTGACSLGDIRLFNGSFEELQSISGDYGIVYSMAFHQYEDRLVLAAGGCSTAGCSASQGQISFWDLSASNIGEQKKIIAHTALVKAIAFSPDGSLLASGSYDTSVLLWDLSNPSRPNQFGKPLDHESFVNDVSFAADNQYLITAGDDRMIYLWDVSYQEKFSLVRTYKEHTAPVTSLAFSPDGSTFASSSDDRKILVWDWSRGFLSLRQRLNTLKGHTGYVKSVSFNADGTILASAGFDNRIILWDVGSGEQIGPSLVLHTKAINDVVFGYDGSRSFMVSVSDDQTAIQWDLASRNPLSLSQNLSSQDGWQSVNQFLIIGDRKLGVVMDGQTVDIYDVSDAKTTDYLKLENFDSLVDKLYFDGSHLITRDRNEDFVQWILNPDDWKKMACDVAKRNLTETEWKSYLKLTDTQTYITDYSGTCPGYKK